MKYAHRVVRVFVKSEVLLVCALVGITTLGGMHLFDRFLMDKYAALESPALLDRSGTLLSMEENSRGSYGRYSTTFPSHALELLVQKEDRYFYWHFGINPASTLRAIARALIGESVGGASTITQQLAKNLLGNENDRTLPNKIIEALGALSLEFFHSKQEILNMYANTVYMGNRVQGLDTASELYFDRPVSEIDDTKLMMLLTTLSRPSGQNPWQVENARTSRNLALRLGIEYDPRLAVVTDIHAYTPKRNFELRAMGLICERTCATTIDADLTERLRIMLAGHVGKSWGAGVRSGALVVLKLPENELLAIIGSPDPSSPEEGRQINMAAEPRAIGSTIKPFIYLKGFENGLRPYTLVNDREYKFPIGTGFQLYPKNYDGLYRGWVTLHYALSNSLNIPSVETLKFVGLDAFYGFLENSLGFLPGRDLSEYEYGIALGALEMDAFTLAQYLSIFPNKGTLRPVTFFLTGTSTPFIRPPMSAADFTSSVAEQKYAALVTKVLHDRYTGVQQFGLESNLNLPEQNYAVKTGTSQDYHDSWTIGYTPDFLVVSWFGNPDNTPLRHISGQQGAGAVWHDAMLMLMNSSYNKHTPFDFTDVVDVSVEDQIDVGLIGDQVSEHRHLLPDTDLIRSPQDGDTFMYDPKMVIPLISPEEVSWHANDELLGSGAHVSFRPSAPGTYTLRATRSGRAMNIQIRVIDRP